MSEGRRESPQQSEKNVVSESDILKAVQEGNVDQLNQAEDPRTTRIPTLEEEAEEDLRKMREQGWGSDSEDPLRWARGQGILKDENDPGGKPIK